MNRLGFLLSVAILSGVESASGQSSGLYAISYSTGQLYSISPTTAAGTLLGSIGLTNIASLELAADGYLYCVVLNPTNPAAATFTRIDPATLVTTTIGPLGLNSLFEGGLAFAPNGVAYAANSGSAAFPQLFLIDRATGAATIVGTMTGGAHDINGLAWRDDGKLIGLDRQSNSLLLIDPSNAAVTLLAPVTPVVGAVGGMTMRGGRGYFATGGTLNPAGSNELWSFDPFTGAQFLIGSLAASSPSGFSGLAGDCRFEANLTSLSLSAGGLQSFSIAAPTAAGKQYFVAGTTGGTYPGLGFGGFLVPLNPDGPGGYFDYCLTNLGAPPLFNSVGSLGGGGLSAAQLIVPAGSPPWLAGLTVHHVFGCFDLPGSGALLSVSNAVPLTLVP